LESLLEEMKNKTEAGSGLLKVSTYLSSPDPLFTLISG